MGYQRVNKIRFLYGVLSEGCLINVLRKLFIVKFLGQNIGVKHNKELLANITWDLKKKKIIITNPIEFQPIAFSSCWLFLSSN